MRSTLCSVVLALSGCATCPSPEAPSLPRAPPQEARLNEPRYTESLKSLVLLEDLYFHAQRVHYLLENSTGYGSIDLVQGCEDLSAWGKRLSRRIALRLEKSRVEDTSWRIPLDCSTTSKPKHKNLSVVHSLGVPSI
ncbi:MAG TPA: hypothetical protein VJH22_02605 [Candidatus Nanoarchaeia archaeon]|nr:hypothetical protein [Candidatus Nanoarchaeia archaeon]